MVGDTHLRLLAHGQCVQWRGRHLRADTKIALYDAQAHRNGENFVLDEGAMTKVIYVPEYTQDNLLQFKEVAAGIGGMGEAATFLGLQGLAYMDINDMACNTLVANGKGVVLPRRSLLCPRPVPSSRMRWSFEVLVDEWLSMPTLITTGGYAGTCRCENTGLLCSHQSGVGTTGCRSTPGMCSGGDACTAHSK